MKCLHIATKKIGNTVFTITALTAENETEEKELEAYELAINTESEDN